MTVGGAASGMTVTGLLPHTEYRLQVVSVNTVGAGPASSVVTATTEEEGRGIMIR